MSNKIPPHVGEDGKLYYNYAIGTKFRRVSGLRKIEHIFEIEN